jgi:hypothetical protein
MRFLVCVVGVLEQTNLLMKVRETLVDQEKNGVEVTCPSNISLYPSQVIFWLLVAFSIVVSIASVVWILAKMG